MAQQRKDSRKKYDIRNNDSFIKIPGIVNKKKQHQKKSTIKWSEPSLLVLWRKPLNVETADYVQIPWVWPRGVLPKTQKRSNAPHAGHAFATNPLLSPWVARGLPGGRPLGMAADTRITWQKDTFPRFS